MAAATGITLVKKFTYRGDANEEYSNTYWISRATPADRTEWWGVVGTLATYERAVYPNTVSVVRVLCYDDDAEGAHAVQQFVMADESVSWPGTLSMTGAEAMPGDDAVWVRWRTTRLSTRGKPIFLRKYFHPAVRSTSPASPDAILPAQKTALEGLGANLLSAGSAAWHVVAQGHHSEGQPTAVLASSYITTRTLKRRGKRPGS